MQGLFGSYNGAMSRPCLIGALQPQTRSSQALTRWLPRRRATWCSSPRRLSADIGCRRDCTYGCASREGHSNDLAFSLPLLPLSPSFSLSLPLSPSLSPPSLSLSLSLPLPLPLSPSPSLWLSLSLCLPLSRLSLRSLCVSLCVRVFLFAQTDSAVFAFQQKMAECASQPLGVGYGLLMYMVLVGLVKSASF